MVESDVPGTRGSESSDPIEPQVNSSLLQELLDRFGVVPPPPLDQEPAGVDAISMRLEHLAEHPSDNLRYVSEGEIGRGGMGTVLRVFDQHLRRRLAMKVARSVPRDHGSHSPRSVSPNLARFLEEAQITSQLEHPGVVPVHELGLDENHQVFFTMRLVRGRSLKEILLLVQDQREGWTLTRALGVLLKVCETMSYAHDRGVIHRDLKPANVMVGRYGEVYVMDWGLARVVGRPDLHDIRPAAEAPSSIRTDLRELREGEEDSPLVTLDGSVIGTPAYMSPEQAAGLVTEVDRRSDVYTLGAMLYHLLTGQPPYLRPGSRLSPHTILALVLQGPPTPIHDLVPRVPAELTAICERAMAREQAQRYPDTSALAADLRAYLEGRVVHAYETGALAELRKWVRRNKALGTALAAAVVIAILGLSGVGYVEAKGRDAVEQKNVELSSALDLAQSSQARAERESRTAEEVVGFLTGMFSEQDPSLARGRVVTVGEALDTAARRMRTALETQPLVRARLMGTLASVHRSLGQLERALSLGEESLALYRNVGGQDDPATWGAAALLGRILVDAGRLEEAESHLMLAFERRRTVYGLEHRDTLDSEDDLAVLRRQQRRLDQALAFQTESLALRERLFGPSDAGTVRAKDHLAALRRDRGELEDAATLAQEVLRVRELDPGPDHPDTLVTMSNLAAVFEELGRRGEARALHERVVGIRSRIFPPNHPDLLRSEHRLAVVLHELGQHEDGEERLSGVLPRSRIALGDRHPATLESARDLALMMRQREAPAEAIDILEALVGPALDRPAMGEPRLAECLALLVELHLAEGRADDARDFAQELMRQAPPDHSHYAAWQELARRARTGPR